jgi:hypothetical protein
VSEVQKSLLEYAAKECDRREEGKEGCAMTVTRFPLYAQDGTRYEAHSVQSRMDTSSMDGFGSIAGLVKVCLADGTPLTPVDENTFQNLRTDEMLTRTPPKPR